MSKCFNFLVHFFFLAICNIRHLYPFPVKFGSKMRIKFLNKILYFTLQHWPVGVHEKIRAPLSQHLYPTFSFQQHGFATYSAYCYFLWRQFCFVFVWIRNGSRSIFRLRFLRLFFRRHWPNSLTFDS